MKKTLLFILATVVFTLNVKAQANIDELKKWVVDEINHNYAQDAENTIGEKVSDVKVAFQGNNLVVNETNISNEYGVRKYKIETIIPLNKINEIPLFTDAIDISENKNLDITIMTAGDEDVTEKQTSEDGSVLTNGFSSHSIYMNLSYGTEKMNKLINAILTIAKESK